MHWGLQIYQITRKDYSMYMDDIKRFAKNEKKIGDSSTNNKNIELGYKNGIGYRKMCNAHKEK